MLLKWKEGIIQVGRDPERSSAPTSCLEAFSPGSLVRGFVWLCLEIASIHLFSDKDDHS